MRAATVTTSPLPVDHRPPPLATEKGWPTLHAHRAGAGEPLVLLHGLGESHIGWRPVIDALAAACDVIAIDLPGLNHVPISDDPKAVAQQMLSFLGQQAPQASITA